jgi:N-acetylglucosaminyl-diphospho-decaprenol L-rhamnosyltransferase
MKKLVIGIITWNSAEKLRVCLDSIFKKILDVDFGVIVVDNGSSDGTVEMVRSQFSAVHLIVNNVNCGVAPARNQFLSIADSEYILILDADTEIVSDSMKDFLAWMDGHPEVGISGAKLVDPQLELQHPCRTLPLPIHVILRRMGSRYRNHPILMRHEMKSENHDVVLDVQFVVGAFQLLRGDLVKKIGLLDDRMFYGFEDSDYCARALKNGYYIVYYPHFKTIHHEGIITKKKVLSKHMYHNVLSYVMFYVKNRDTLLREAARERTRTTHVYSKA